MVKIKDFEEVDKIKDLWSNTNFDIDVIVC